MQTTSALPDFFWLAIENCLKLRGYSYTQPGKLSQAVLKLSDHYNQGPGSISPWHQKDMQAAYLAYFLPLNTLRTFAVWREASRRGFLTELDLVFDFGTGLGSIHLGWQCLQNQNPSLASHAGFEFSVYDQDEIVFELQDEFYLALKNSFAARSTEPSGNQPSNLSHSQSKPSDNPEMDRHESDKSAHAGQQKIWQSQPVHQQNLSSFQKNLVSHPQKSLLAFSYVLTEMQGLPAWAKDAEALMILEPSTRTSGRNLSVLRAELQASGFHIWAPCTHQEMCPMLSNERDWCHARLHIQTPETWNALEAMLPMKNRTVTYSYLLARKTPMPKTEKLVRVVGDVLIEKGRNRVLLCQDSSPQFLQWMPQRLSKEQNESLALHRGDLLKMEIPADQFKNGIWKLTDPKQIQTKI